MSRHRRRRAYRRRQRAARGRAWDRAHPQIGFTATDYIADASRILDRFARAALRMRALEQRPLLAQLVDSSDFFPNAIALERRGGVLGKRATLLVCDEAGSSAEAQRVHDAPLEQAAEALRRRL